MAKNSNTQSIDELLYALKERAKELSCLYQVEELLSQSDITIEEICQKLIEVIPPGWQFPEICRARISLNGNTYCSPDFVETEWRQCADIVVQEEKIGEICVFYTEHRPNADEGPFLKEERKLINTIAERLAQRILHEKLKKVFQEKEPVELQKANWWLIIDLLKRTDPNLLVKLARKMLNYLCWHGIPEAERFLEEYIPSYRRDEVELMSEINIPHKKHLIHDILTFSDEIFKIAGKYLSEKEIINVIQKWIQEDRSSFLVNVLENPGSSLADLSSAIERYHHLSPHGVELPAQREIGFRVSLIRRLLTDQPEFINIAKKYLEIDDFYELLHRVIYPAGSHGKLGGKSSGLILAANILKKTNHPNEHLKRVKTPKTWYIASDGILKFINYNNLEEVVEQKYKEISQVRQEYPFVVHVFKNSLFPPEIVNGLSVCLDDFGEVPLIVRSSSLLEDRMGTAFAGKYKSLFLANQGTKEQRLLNLMDAIAEVYASTFGPDPIEYRMMRGLLDLHEEMGIMIQEVVGTRIGKYYLPAFAGVAFSRNEFRWSKRLKREDGLIRMVPGLGTRAVDRLRDDYPILIAPGQPDLRVNVTIEEKIRYSPKKIDVIDLETNTFETIDIRQLLRECGNEYPLIEKIVSIVEQDHIRQPGALGIDFQNDYPVVTFEGIVNDTDFPQQILSILQVLEDVFQTPVDIEFAHDGKDFYLLQCRPLSFGAEYQPAEIPTNIPREQILFLANKYVPNGVVSDITHIVYVDPQKYAELKSHNDMLAVGKAIGHLNQILPKRQFILMGPGRWGSRGDIKLGVNVTYSSINNTAMLIEIARKERDYEPDVSFGTHFFQDLVESNIRYLPLYPDSPGAIFNEDFLKNSENILGEILPEFAHLKDTIFVIDITKVTGGKVLQVLMNSDMGKAVAVLTEPHFSTYKSTISTPPTTTRPVQDEHWRWRLQMVERMASFLDPQRFGVKGLYLFGSTKNATAGPASDIDILVHFQGTDEQKKELLSWLDGWSLCLGQMNYLRTGYKTDRLLDIHIITDEDIINRTSYALKIGAPTDAARPLPLGTALRRQE